MSKQTEIISSIIQAPATFRSRGTPSLGLEGTVDAIYNGILIIKTRIGEIILKVLDGEHAQAGTKVFLYHDKDSEIVKISSVNKSVSKSLSSPSNIKGQDFVRPYSTLIYGRKNTQIDEIKAHHTAAEATLNTAINYANKEDAFDVARAICLMPDIDRDRGMISIMTFLLVSLTRGNTKSWSGEATNTVKETTWDHVMMERIIDGPDTNKWKTRQFPINLTEDTLWAIFATPSVSNSPVGRFIIEISTSSYGLVQVKAFGQGDTCEIVITSNTAFNDDLKTLCRSTIMKIADEIDAQIEISFVSDPAMLANLTQARRMSFEA